MWASSPITDLCHHSASGVQLDQSVVGRGDQQVTHIRRGEGHVHCRVHRLSGVTWVQVGHVYSHQLKEVRWVKAKVQNVSFCLQRCWFTYPDSQYKSVGEKKGCASKWHCHPWETGILRQQCDQNLMNPDASHCFESLLTKKKKKNGLQTKTKKHPHLLPHSGTRSPQQWQ